VTLLSPSPSLGATVQAASPAAGEGAEPEDFEEIYRRHADLVRRTVWSLSGAEDLDDIVQEVFVRLWRSWNSFEGRSDRRTWIYRVTLNTARSHWRGRGRFKAALKRFFLAAPRSDAVPPDQERWERDARLASALKALAPRLREALTLVSLEGLSVEETSRILGIPPGTVKSRMHQARFRMQVLLEEEPHGTR